MTLNGSKAAGTDIHTITANQVGMDRNSAKILNYARLYLCGKQNALDLLGPRDGARMIVDELWRFTKGKQVLIRNPVSQEGKKILSEGIDQLEVLTENEAKRFKFLVQKMQSDTMLRDSEKDELLQSIYKLVPAAKKTIDEIEDLFDEPRRVFAHGIESELFNYLQLTAIENQPVTPVLGGNLPMPLLNRLAPMHQTTRCNWLIQSSAVDFLHLFLANMDYLIKKYRINAFYSLSIHDMIQFISSKEDRYRTALAFQLAHLYTRAYFSLKCGLPQLPQNVAFFSSVEIDRSMRKDKELPWNTGLYGDDPGTAETLDISRIIELTNGTLSND